MSQEQSSNKKENKVELSQEQFTSLMNRINQLENARPKSELEATAKAIEGFSVKGPTGVIKKYPTDEDFYPDPTGDLSKLPELKRYAFDENYRLKWKVTAITYETKWGTHVREPIFRLSLYRKHYDPETGEPSGKWLLIQHGIFTEDEAFVAQQAEDLGIQVSDKRKLMDDIRYFRFKQWLLSAINPRPPKLKKKEKSEMVVGGSVFRTEEWEEAV